jgi:hypothetical protein
MFLIIPASFFYGLWQTQSKILVIMNSSVINTVLKWWEDTCLSTLWMEYIYIYIYIYEIYKIYIYIYIYEIYKIKGKDLSIKTDF